MSGALHDVTPATERRLRSLVEVHGWEPRLSEADGTYRAWIRSTDGRRMFGRPASTAEEAARALIAKVEPMAKGGRS